MIDKAKAHLDEVNQFTATSQEAIEEFRIKSYTKGCIATNRLCYILNTYLEKISCTFSNI